MILGICDTEAGIKVLNICKLMITFVKILVPIGLIVAISIDLLKAIKTGNDDLLVKAKTTSIKRLVAGTMIFLFPTFVNVVIDLTDGSDSEIHRCLNLTVDEVITNSSTSSIENLRNNLTYENYNNVKIEINKIEDETTKKQKLSELESLYPYIDIRNSIKNLSKSYSDEKYNQLKEKVSQISDTTVKNNLQKELDDAYKNKK